VSSPRSPSWRRGELRRSSSLHAVRTRYQRPWSRGEIYRHLPRNQRSARLPRARGLPPVLVLLVGCPTSRAREDRLTPLLSQTIPQDRSHAARSSAATDSPDPPAILLMLFAVPVPLLTFHSPPLASQAAPRRADLARSSHWGNFASGLYARTSSRSSGQRPSRARRRLRRRSAMATASVTAPRAPWPAGKIIYGCCAPASHPPTKAQHPRSNNYTSGASPARIHALRSWLPLTGACSCSSGSSGCGPELSSRREPPSTESGQL